MYCDDPICSEWWNDSKTANFPIMINIQLSCLSWNYCDKWLQSLIRSGEESKMGPVPSSASSQRSSQLLLSLLRRNLLPCDCSCCLSLLSCVQHLMYCVGCMIWSTWLFFSIENEEAFKIEFWANFCLDKSFRINISKISQFFKTIGSVWLKKTQTFLEKPCHLKRPTFQEIKICLCLTSSASHNFVLPFVLALRKHNEALTMALCPWTVVCEDFFLKQMFLQGLNKDFCTLKAQ